MALIVDVALDRKIAQNLDVRMTHVPEYTASVDGCLDLWHRLLPSWRWRLGHGASRGMPGVFVPHVGCRFEVTAPMLLPALLIVIAEARLVREPGPPP